MHNLSHPGIKATQKLIGERFVWPNMRRDIAEKYRTCISCQQTKITRHQVTPLQHFRTPDARFSHVHVDIVGPPPDSSGYKYLLIVVDRFTRWPEAIPSVFLRRFMVTKRPHKFSLRHLKISLFQSMAPLKYWYACSTKKLFC